MSRPWHIGATGLFLTVRLTPKGGRDEMGAVETLADGRSVLKTRVRAAPTEGQANDALISLIAKTLDVARSKVTLAAGETARIKRIAVEGDGEVLAARLETIVSRRT